MHGPANEDPAHVRPPFSVHWRVRIAVLVRIFVVDAVSGDPEDGTALEGEARKNGKSVFNPARSFVAAVSEQAVVTHADAQAARNPPEKHRDEEGFPGEEEESGNGAKME